MFHCSDQNRQPTTSCYHSLHLTESGFQMKAIVNTCEMILFMPQSVMKKLLNHSFFKVKISSLVFVFTSSMPHSLTFICKSKL